MKQKAMEIINNYMTEQQGWDIDEMASYRRRVLVMYEKEVDHIMSMNSKGNQFMSFFNIFGFSKHNFEYETAEDLAKLAIERVNKIFSKVFQ